jgi:hypothetical protein
MGSMRLLIEQPALRRRQWCCGHDDCPGRRHRRGGDGDCKLWGGTTSVSGTNDLEIKQNHSHKWKERRVRGKGTIFE